MALTPFIMIASDRFLRRRMSMDGIDAADDLAGRTELELDLTEPSSWVRLKLTAPRL